MWWRSTHRPNYENSLLLEDPNAWACGRDVCSRFITNISGVLGADISEELNLHSFFNGAGVDKLEQLHQLSDYIRSSVSLNTDASAEFNNACHLLTYLSCTTRSPFFHTPNSVRYLMRSLVSYLYEIPSRECFSATRRTMVMYDPCAGYGELLWLPNSNIKTAIYYDLLPDAPGEALEPLTAWILKRLHGSGVCERKSLSPEHGDQVDVIMSNPPHAWLPDMTGFDWHYISHHIDLLSPTGIYVTTCSQNQFKGTYDDDYMKSTILSTRYLKYIIKLPTRLLRGAPDAQPLILVFKKSQISSGVLYIDGTYTGYSHGFNSSYDIIRDQDIALLTKAHGIISTFKNQSYMLNSRMGAWAVRVIKDMNELDSLFE